MLDKILRPSDIESYQTVGELTHFEMLRSRRYQRPLSVFSLIPVSIEERLQEQQIEELYECTRRIDIFEMTNVAQGIIYLICPETNVRGSQSLAARLKANPVLSRYKLGHATFPEDGSSIELLLETARERAKEIGGDAEDENSKASKGQDIAGA